MENKILKPKKVFFEHFVSWKCVGCGHKIELSTKKTTTGRLFVSCFKCKRDYEMIIGVGDNATVSGHTIK